MSLVRKFAAWLPPLLGLALAVVLPWYLYARGSLDSLTSAFMVGSSIVIAGFTMALWLATRTQAEATREMQELQKALVAHEETPLLVLDSVRFVYKPPHIEYESGEQAVGDPERVNMAVECVNLSKYGLVIKDVEVFVAGAPDEEPRCVARGSSSITMGAGEGVDTCLLAAFGCNLHSEQVRGVFGAFFDSPANGRPRVFLRLKAEYAGAPGQIQSVCFEVRDIVADGLIELGKATLRGKAWVVKCHPSWGDCCV